MASNPDLERLRRSGGIIRSHVRPRVDSQPSPTDIRGMEAKLATLEAQMDGVRADLAKLAPVPVDLANLRGDIRSLDGKVDARTAALDSKVDASFALLNTKIDALPTKDYLDDKFGKMLTRIGILVAIIGGIVGLAVRFIPA